MLACQIKYVLRYSFSGIRLFVSLTLCVAPPFPVVPTGSPRDISLQISARQISLTWKPPAQGEANGPVTGYEILLVRDGQERSNRSLVKRAAKGQMMYTVGGNHTTFIIKDLEPYKGYCLQMAAVNVNGTGPFSNASCFTTLQDGKYSLRNCICGMYTHSVILCCSKMGIHNMYMSTAAMYTYRTLSLAVSSSCAFKFKSIICGYSVDFSVSLQLMGPSCSWEYYTCGVMLSDFVS